MRTTADGSNSLASRSYCPRHIEQTVVSLSDSFGLCPLP
jgi:hypothetical protein